MKKVLVVVFALLISLAAFSMAFKDVPKSHWAYEAVNALSDWHILTGFEDGTFRGSEVVTRYQLAVALYRAIEYLKSQIGGAGSVGTTALPSDKLSLAFQKIAKNEIAIANLEKLIADMRKKMGMTPVQAGVHAEDVKAALELAKDAKSLAEENKAAIAALDSKLQMLEMNLKAGKGEVTLPEEVNRKLENLLATVSGMKTDLSEIDVLKERYGNLSKKVIYLEQQVNEASGKAEKVKEEFDALKKDFEDLSKKVQDLSTNLGKVDEIGKKVGSLESRVSSLEETVRNMPKAGGFSFWDFLSIASMLMSVVALVFVFTVGK